MGSCSIQWAGGLPRRKFSDNEQGDVAEAFKWPYFLEGFRSSTPPYPPPHTHTIFALNLPGNQQTEQAGTSHKGKGINQTEKNTAGKGRVGTTHKPSSPDKPRPPGWAKMTATGPRRPFLQSRHLEGSDRSK